ncbi:MAG: MATE family efflux transporter, partial [Muribaculaceae bacterium]|nr:MATE family efflux transporter [Muribaculaceae bacterium]
ANDPPRYNSVFGRAGLLAFILAAIGVFFRTPLLALFIGIIDPGKMVADSASLYFTICVWGIPPLLMTLSINGWFIGMQNTVAPMCISISMNLFNVVASICAVYVFKAGFAGVAYGTLIANWTGLCLAIAIVIFTSRRYKLKILSLKEIIAGGFGKFFRVSSDLFLRSACIMSVSMAVTAIGARMGDLTMAVNTIMVQFFLFFSYFMDGFSFAGEALVGKHAGASKLPEVYDVTKQLMKWSAAMAIAFMLIYLFGASLIATLITDVENVREGINKMRVFIWILPPIAVWAFIYDGVFIGLTATRRMFLTTFVATLLFASVIAIGWHFYPFSAHPSTGNRILWSAFLGFLAVRGIGLALQFKTAVKHYHVT